MTYLSQMYGLRRAPRARFAEITPAVLRLENGGRVSGKLQVVSITGGLLSLTQHLNQGSHVKLMFVTQSGTVLGAAEMLRPVPSGAQPFKFTTLLRDDQRRLEAAIQSSRDHDRRDRGQIETYRAW
jgi:hypothetical protein